MKTPVTNTNDPAVERNISRSDMDIVIAVLDKIPELNEVPAQLDTIQALEASVVDKASKVSASATSATTKANEASTSASNALTSETNADASEVMAHKWAQEAEDVIVTGTLGIDDEYSAYHWAQKAQAAVGGNITLGSLYDVDTVGIVDGGIITYNQSTGKYAPYDFRHNPYIGLNTTSGTTAGVGQFTWNATEGTADLGLPNGVTLQLGQENNRLVRNNTASTILNGTVVVATGSIGASGRITVAPCGGTSNDVHAIYGVTTQDILAGEDGFITIDGKVRLINTSGSSVGETWSDGDVLYVKPNDNGRLTNVVPSVGELKVSIAKVIRAHATTGVLEVRTLSVLDENAYEPRNTNIQSHITNIANPHGVTKLQIGLGNAENTADNVKNVLSATKWTTARLFNGVSVDGTANATIPVNTTQKSDSVSYNIPFVSSVVAGNQDLYTDSETNLTYNPSTNTLTTTTFAGALSGNAGTADKLKIIEIGNAEDLNTITTGGLYHQSSSAGASTGTNYPEPLAGLLEVVGIGVWFIYQTYHVYNSHKVYKRAKYSTANWTAWELNAIDVLVDSTQIGAIRYNGTTPLAGAFSGGTTAPLPVGNRLNYSGYFHPAYINLGASADTSETATHYFVEIASDGFVRPKTLANVRAEIITKAALLSADPYYFNSGVGTSGIAATTNYPIFPAGNDTLTLGVGTYRVSLTMYCAVATSTVSASLMINMRGAGTAVGTTWGMTNSSITNWGAANQTVHGGVVLGNTHTVTPTSALAGRAYTVYLEMVMNITTAGTIIPSYQWSATLTSGEVTLHALNNIVIDKMAETSVTTAGGWV